MSCESQEPKHLIHTNRNNLFTWKSSRHLIKIHAGIGTNVFDGQFSFAVVYVANIGQCQTGVC